MTGSQAQDLASNFARSLAFVQHMQMAKRGWTEQDWNREQYATGAIDLEEYERREEIRLSREAANPLSGKAA